MRAARQRTVTKAPYVQPSHDSNSAKKTLRSSHHKDRESICKQLGIRAYLSTGLPKLSKPPNPPIQAEISPISPASNYKPSGLRDKPGKGELRQSKLNFKPLTIGAIKGNRDNLQQDATFTVPDDTQLAGPLRTDHHSSSDCLPKKTEVLNH